jgi:hypothetical protein
VRLEFAVLTKTKEVSIDRHAAAAEPARVDRITELCITNEPQSR